MPEQNTARIDAYTIGPLIQALGSSDPEIQLTALDALLSLPVADDVWQPVGEYCMFVLRGIDAQAQDFSLPPADRFLWLAAAVPIVEVRDTMRKLANGDHPDARIARDALAWAGDQAMQPFLLAELQDPQAFANHLAIAEVLSYLDVGKHIPAYARLIRDHEDNVVCFYLSLPLARIGRFGYLDTLIDNVYRHGMELPILWGDPERFADEVIDRGPYPEEFAWYIAELAEMTGYPAIHALATRLNPAHIEIVPPRHTASAKDASEARALADKWLANPPFSTGAQISGQHGQSLISLDQDTLSKLQETLLEDARKSYRAGSRFRAGNSLVLDLRPVFVAIPALIDHYLRLPYSDAHYKTQLAWLLARQEITAVINQLMERLWQAGDEDRRQNILSLVRDVGAQVGVRNPPIYGTRGGSRYKFRPSRGVLANLTTMHALDFMHEALVSGDDRQAKPELPERYANATLLDAADDTRPDKSQVLEAAMAYRLRVDIGALSDSSDVENPQPIPKELLPDEDLWLDVLLSSTDFAVGLSQESLCEENTIAITRLMLPRDGGPARTVDGGLYIDFWLRAPASARSARARLSLYYHNHLVQGLLLRAYIGEMPETEITNGQEVYLASLPPLTEGFALHTDFTLSRSLVDIAPLPLRRQVSILTNDNGNGRHQIVVRAGDEHGVTSAPITYELRDEVIGATITAIRNELRSDRIIPTAPKRTRSQLKDALTRLAPLGWQLRTLMGGETIELEDYLYDWDDVVIQVSRPNSSSAAFPWGLVYDIPIDTSKPLTFCPSIEGWDEQSPLVQTESHTCPHGNHEANVLCPFGFWAYRYPIEQLASTGEPALLIQPTGSPEMLAALTQYNANLGDLDAHIAVLQDLVSQHMPGINVNVARDLNDIQAHIGQDQPLIYFYCHGERLRNNDPNTFLGVGNREELKAQDFIGWVMDWRRPPTRRKIWHKVRPLVFINACHSLEITPETLVSYLDAFVGWGNAAGVIGTEVKVSQTLAMDFAMRFFAGFTAGRTVAQALHVARMHYLANGNLFGLVYTPYCFADLRLEIA